MNFKKAKGIIRKALAEASDAELTESLDAARSGAIPFFDKGRCLAAHLLGEAPAGKNALWWGLSDAYFAMDPTDDGQDPNENYGDPRRQRVIIPMILAEIRRRNRARDLDAIETVTMAELFGGGAKGE